MFDIFINEPGIHMDRKVRVGTETDFESARMFVFEGDEVAHFEEDADHPGCADFLLKNGKVGCIEKRGFDLETES